MPKPNIATDEELNEWREYMEHHYSPYRIKASELEALLNRIDDVEASRSYWRAEAERLQREAAK